ncbi:hypothetical protein [Cerasicoccus fimbriatus]|uniref:hypothetical protein n=1 Tax=Cerasicoccus fimbriatus TaxID=3014554 RepID=UPI0022B49C70|nr:hypothetical protein [Cerasicoccus sp. TK19100]
MKDKLKLLTAILAITPIALMLNGCETTESASTQAPPVQPAQPIQVSGTQLDPYNMAKVRTPEAIHAYHLGPYVDPQDSGIRHDGHRIARVERPAQWNLTPSAPTAVPLGPVVAVADPAQQTGLLTGELENKITQANNLIAALIEQNDQLQGQLQQKDKAIENLSRRISNLEEQ